MASIANEYNEQRSWFLTGATGFIGREVVRRLITQTDDRIVLLVRSKAGKSASARLASLLRGLALETARSRIAIHDGCVSAARFGLSDDVWHRLAATTTHIVHMAALTRFDASLRQARRSNYESAKHLVEFAHAARQAGGLQRMTHVSTAYVAGATQACVDGEHIEPQGRFRNTYEQSKCEAEAWIREQMTNLPITIVRPAIVIGDSRTGEVTGFNTIYWSIRTYLRGINVVFARTDASLDLVPVDYVADALLHIHDQPEAEGRCYILAGGERTAVSLGELAQRCCDYFGTPTPWVLPPQIVAPLGALAKAPFVSRKTQRFINQAQSYLPYFVRNPRFDVTATENALAGSGIQVPRLEDYIDTLLDYCLSQGWGENSPVLRKSRHDEACIRHMCRAAAKRV